MLPLPTVPPPIPAPPLMPSPTPLTIVPVPPDTTLTYDQSFQLMNDDDFKGRVQVACLAFAQSITLEGPDAPAHNTRLRWAQNVFLNPVFVAAQVAPPTVMNPNVQQAGSEITDQNLQAAVQATVNELI